VDSIYLNQNRSLVKTENYEVLRGFIEDEEYFDQLSDF
jgi:hypothetical protein